MNDVRRFGLADGLILIAGAAVGLGFVRSIHPGMPWRTIEYAFQFPKGWPWHQTVQIAAGLCVIYVIPFVAAWTPACLLVQLRRPRARRLRRAPGFLACLLPTLVCALTIAITWACLGEAFWNPLYPNKSRWGLLVGFGVLWSWATMRIAGFYLARPTWTDRLGRLTGVAWILIGLLSGVHLLLMY